MSLLHLLHEPQSLLIYGLILDAQGEIHQLTYIVKLNCNLLVSTQDKYSQNVANEELLFSFIVKWRLLHVLGI